MKLTPCLLLLVLLTHAQAESVRLEWQPSPSSGIQTYRVYYGTNTGSYSFVTNAGLCCTQSVELPQTGRWFFAVTACDTNQVESDFSNEVQWEARPEPPKLKTDPSIRLTCIIERSTNSVDWVEADSGPIFFTTTNAAEFFRAGRLKIERLDLAQ